MGSEEKGGKRSGMMIRNHKWKNSEEGGRKKNQKDFSTSLNMCREEKNSWPCLRVVFISRWTLLPREKEYPEQSSPLCLGHLLAQPWCEGKVLSLPCWSFCCAPVSCKALWSLFPLTPAASSLALEHGCTHLHPTPSSLRSVPPVSLAVQNHNM